MSSHGRNYYQVCTRCIMDTTDPNISFDEDGICNHCRGYEVQARRRLLPPVERKRALDSIVDEMKAAGRGKDYDCILGLSGGVDSTYVAYLAKKLGLRPFAIHMDNGWNSEVAVRNIERAMRKLDIDLYTEVLDWEEFKDIQLAFLRASVLDIEMITDYAIYAVVMKMVSRHGIKYMLSGNNVVTEGILPKAWGFNNRDITNIRAIHQRFGKRPMRTFPRIGYAQVFKAKYLDKVTEVKVLDLVDYNKAEAVEILKRDLDWEPYGGKHCESVFTRFFQCYYLPRKFGADKRLAHLSTLINSGQLSRDDALAEMREPPYPAALMEEDRRYVIQKLGLTEAEFEEIMAKPPVPHESFPNSVRLLKLYKRMRGLG